MPHSTGFHATRHQPVLPAEVIEALAPMPGETYFDLTVGAGGHSALIAERLTNSGVIHAFDRDPNALKISRERLGGLSVPIHFHHTDFGEVPGWIGESRLPKADLVLADLGVSSMMFDDPARGFSFQHDAPLDMRMNPGIGITAAEYLAHVSEKELADVIYRYGEERFSRRIARRIREHREMRPITSTGELADIVTRAIPAPARRRSRIHPATRTFQALRIIINDEIEQIHRLLAGIDAMLNPGGRFAVITFHSLEDRPVKLRFKELAASGRYYLWRKKPVTASERERMDNPRARSAKLRALIRTGDPDTPETAG